jgi:hypothetical protein
MIIVVPGYFPTPCRRDVYAGHHRGGVPRYENGVRVRDCNGKRVSVESFNGNHKFGFTFRAPIKAFAPKDEFCGIALPVC